MKLDNNDQFKYRLHELVLELHTAWPNDYKDNYDSQPLY
jgi:hypothetical protein